MYFEYNKTLGSTQILQAKAYVRLILRNDYDASKRIFTQDITLGQGLIEIVYESTIPLDPPEISVRFLKISTSEGAAIYSLHSYPSKRQYIFVKESGDNFAFNVL